MKKIAGRFSAIPILILLLMLAGRMPALAQSDDPSAPKPVVLTDEQEEYPLGPYLEILKDRGGKLTIGDATSPAYDSQFTPSQVKVPNYGFTNDAYWVRFHLKNNTSRTDRWLIVLGFINMQYADLYLPNAENAGWTATQTGILRPFHTRDIANRHIIFDLSLSPQEERTIYMRFQNGASMTLPLTIWLPEAFFQRYSVELLFLGLFYGALLIMLVYHLFVLYSLRDVSYLYYVCFLATAILYFASYDAIAAQYLWPSQQVLNRFAVPVFVMLCMASILLFVDAFLEASARHPGMHRLILFMTAGWGILLVLAFFVSYHLTADLFTPYALISSAVAVVAGLISWRSGYEPARFYLFSWVGLLIGVILTLLVREGLTASTGFSENFFRFGLLWLAAFWSISLTDRVNLLKSETETANRALQSSEHQLSQILEGLPLAVVVYGKNRKPSYGNKRTSDILSNSARGIHPDISAGRTLEMAIDYFSLKKEGTDQPYPMDRFPIQSALNGVPAYADDIEADLGDGRIPLEVWASPVRDDAGNVESAIVAFQDISQRKQAETELSGYRNQLETLVEERTTNLNQANEKLKLQLSWISAVNKVHDSITGTASLAGVNAELSGEILHLLGAELVFIHRWENQGNSFDALSNTHTMDGPHNLDFVKTLFTEGSRLRGEIEMGKILSYTSKQADSLRTLFGEHAPKHEMPSFVFVPLRIGQSVIGVLGVAASAASQNRIVEESDLVERMALDLASLTQGAILLDQAVVLATVEERNRLARELHDSVTQTMFTASVLAEATSHIWQKNPGIARQNMAKLSRLIRGALAEMRSMLIELRMGDLHRQTLEQLLITLVDGARARSQAAITLSLMEDLPVLPEKIVMCFYRIAREGINNATVHSGATQIHVSLFEEDGQLKLRIQDDGCGFDPKRVPAGHLGINIMDERAREIGASLQIHTSPGHGTNISIAWSDQTEKRIKNE